MSYIILATESVPLGGKMRHKKHIYLAMTLLVLFVSSSPNIAQSQEAQEGKITAPIKSWLVLGPFKSPLPAFHNVQDNGYSVADLLKFQEIDIAKLRASSGASLTWHSGLLAQWKEVNTVDSIITLAAEKTQPATAYLGVYLDVQRWTKAKLTLEAPQALQVFLDGAVIATKAKADMTKEGEASVDGKEISADLKLENGLHLILLKTVYDPNSNSDWTLEAALTFDQKFASPPPRFALEPMERMTIAHLLDGPKTGGLSISPDGTLAALTIRKTLPPSDSSESWVEIVNVADGRRLQTYRGGTSVSGVIWAPVGKKFSYLTRKNSKGTVWVVDLEKGTSIPLIENIENLDYHVWAPDGSHILYSVSVEPKEDKRGVKRFLNLADRQPWWRTRSFLYIASVPEGVSQRLTSGKFSTSLNNISPNGKELLFTRSYVDYSERPFSKTELFTLNLETLEVQSLWKGSWLNNAQWSPKGDKILVLGSPSTFGKTGWNVSEKRIPNEYDGQAYLFDPSTKEAEALTRNFAPSIGQALWSQTEDCIYFTTADRSYRHLYRYDLAEKTFKLVDCGVEVLGQFRLARKAPVAVYTGSSASVPPRYYAIDLKTQKFRLLHDPGAEDFADVRFGDVERWTFTNKRGVEIEGRIYYPPGFNPTNKYPCIVYYYGGTSPVDRSFGGRYPKNLYAANGYVVYVLQPSGAVGFGQEFSSYHVNDWGIVVADEIIEGTIKFLQAHPFVDTKRVGCIGASYGGFMTMLLLTRTDMFAAGIAHAGISSISSYWGEGYWGYAYNAVSAANSFPWNRKDIYINQSALFHADKITTPLLLLHGSVDTNVPSGESTQLFTALKILGRDVEYIQVLDQDHHIMRYNKRKLWTRTILAYFDKWLKDQPDWWDDLYPMK